MSPSETPSPWFSDELAAKSQSSHRRPSGRGWSERAGRAAAARQSSGQSPAPPGRTELGCAAANDERGSASPAEAWKPQTGVPVLGCGRRGPHLQGCPLGPAGRLPAGAAAAPQPRSVGRLSHEPGPRRVQVRGAGEGQRPWLSSFRESGGGP